MDYIPYEPDWLFLGIALVGILASLAILLMGLSRFLPRALGVIFALLGVLGLTAGAAFGGFQLLPLAHQAQVAEKLTEHYEISFNLLQVIELGYPSERPAAGSALAYGTITVADKDLTLIWDGEQMQLGEPSTGKDPYIFLEPQG